MTVYIDGREQNPWNLTATEIKAFDAMIKYGSIKRAAAALNLEPDTIKGYTHTGGRKIAPNDKLPRYLAWFAWRNGLGVLAMASPRFHRDMEPSWASLFSSDKPKNERKDD